MIIGGLEKLTLIDYPDHLSAIIFTQGCNFRCHFCYNPMLVWPRTESDGSNNKEESSSLISETELFSFLKERKNKLDGVVITGGEPTLHKDLPEFIAKIKKMGYDIKLDSNGTNPQMLEKLIKENLINYLAMDIKAPLDKYEQVVGVKTDFMKIQKSVKIIKESGLGYEFRTTLVPELLNKEDIEKMGEIIKGADKWYLQKFKSDTKLVDEAFEKKQGYSQLEMEEISNIAKNYAKHVDIRG